MTDSMNETGLVSNGMTVDETDLAESKELYRQEAGETLSIAEALAMGVSLFWLYERLVHAANVEAGRTDDKAIGDRLPER